MSADLFPEVLLASLYVLVPGSALCLATRAGVGRSVFTFLSLAFGLGFASVGAVSLLLASIGVLRPGILLASWVAGSAIALTVATRRGSFGRFSRGWREVAGRDPWATASAAVVVIGVAIARVMVPPLTAIAPTVTRYWADALELADAGRMPEGTLQWGTVLQPTTSKVVLNAFNAGASMLLGREVAVSQAALLLVVTVGLVVTGIALLSELGMPRLAPLGAMLLFVNYVVPHDLSTDLGRNLAENWGRLASFSAVLACVLALAIGDSDPSPETPPGGPGIRLPLVVVSGVLLGLSAGTHLVAASFGAGAIFAIAVATWIMRGWRPSSLLAGSAVIGLALVIGGAILALAPGEMGFTGAVGADPYRQLRADLHLPPTFDPTRFITTHDAGAAAQKVEPLDVAGVAETFAYKVGGYNVLRVVPGEERSTLILALPTIVALLLVAGVLLVGPTRLRISVLWAVILGVIIFVVGLAFALHYDEFVLASFGNRRLFSYAIVAYVTVLTAAGEAALIRLGAGGSWRIASMCAAAVVVASTAVFIPRIVGREGSDEPWASQLALVTWVGQHVPCEGRVLADRRTLGTFEVIAGRAAVLEGMGPHIRPAVLERAIREIFGAQEFFADPEAGLRYLRDRSVAAVVVTRPSTRSGFIGYAIARVRPDRLDRVPFLTPGFRNAAGSVYLVNGYRPDPSAPGVAGRPGFLCHEP